MSTMRSLILSECKEDFLYTCPPPEKSNCLSADYGEDHVGHFYQEDRISIHLTRQSKVHNHAALLAL